MNIDVTTLPDDVNSLKEIILNLKSKYDDLIEQIRLEKQRRYSPKTESHINQPSLFDECGLPDEIADNESQEVIVKQHIRQNKPKRTTLPDDLPRTVVLHDLPDSEKICDCGCEKERFGEEITEQLEIVPAKLTVTQHVRPKYCCPNCQSNIAIADKPTLLLPKSIAAPSLVAHIIVSKYVDHLPLYRQEQIFKRLAIHLPRNTTCEWVMKTAELCEPLWWLLKKHLMAQQYLQADETTLQVLQEVGRRNQCKSYIWVYRGGPPNRQCVLYDYQSTRSAQHAKEFLQDFKGYLQTDGYSGYDWVDKHPDITHLACMAHARRPFAELVKLANKPGKAHHIIGLIARLYNIEKDARVNNLSHAQRHQVRLDKAEPVLVKINAWLEEHVAGTANQSKLGKGIRYMLTRWQNLTNYLKDGSLEIDNNLIENAIRPFVVGRGNWLFAGSPRGAEASATLYSLIMTCKENNIDAFTYFNAMLPEIRRCNTEDDFKKLLPFNISL